MYVIILLICIFSASYFWVILVPLVFSFLMCISHVFKNYLWFLCKESTGSKNTAHSLSLWQLPPQRKPTYHSPCVSCLPNKENQVFKKQSWKDIKELFAQTKPEEEDEVKELERDVGFSRSLAAPRTTKGLLILKTRFIEQSFRLCGRRRGWDVSREQHRTCILSRVKQITSPGWMHETSARTWCTGKT